MQALIFNGVGRTRRVVEDGTVWLVAPITSIMADGVLPGSQGPLLYPTAEIKRSVPEWDGTPITVGHPSLNGRHVSAMEVPHQHIGHLRNTHFDGKLIHEGWFDEEKTKAADKYVWDALVHHKKVECSSGLYTVNVPAANGQGLSPSGRPYAAVATEYRPDHMAILPREVGACSNDDGCGLMVNAKGDLTGGHWVTTDEGNHIYIKGSAIVAGNPKVVAAAKGKDPDQAPAKQTSEEIPVSAKSPALQKKKERMMKKLGHATKVSQKDEGDKGDAGSKSKADDDYAKGRIPSDHIVSYNQDRVVHHATGSDVAAKIQKDGFKTGKEANPGRSSARGAIYFADKGMVEGSYARTGEGEENEGQKGATVPINLKGLRLKNLSLDGNGSMFEKGSHRNLATMGDMSGLPKDVDGYISYDDKGKIAEVVLSKDTSNKLLKEQKKTNNSFTVNLAISEAQRRFLNATKGHDWVKAHSFDNHGKLPEHVEDEEDKDMNANQKRQLLAMLGEALGVTNDRHNHDGRFAQTAKGAARKGHSDLTSGYDDTEPRGMGQNQPGDDGRDTVKGSRQDIDLDGDGDGPVGDDSWRKQDEETEETEEPPSQPGNRKGGPTGNSWSDAAREASAAARRASAKASGSGDAKDHKAAAQAHENAAALFQRDHKNAESRGVKQSTREKVVEHSQAASKHNDAAGSKKGERFHMKEKAQANLLTSNKGKDDEDDDRCPECGGEMEEDEDGKERCEECGYVENTLALNELWITYNREWPQAKRDQLDEKDFAGPSQSFPIATQEDLDAAVQSIGRAKNPQQVKAGIKRIAKRKGLKLPATNTRQHGGASKPVKGVKAGSADAVADVEGQQGKLGAAPSHVLNCPKCGATMNGATCNCGWKAGAMGGGMAMGQSNNALSVTTPPAPISGGQVMGQGEMQSQQAHQASSDAAAASMDHPDARGHAIKAFDKSKVGKSDKASDHHDDAADAHDQAATQAFADGDQDAASGHLNAAALHRKAKSMHDAMSATTTNQRQSSDGTKPMPKQPTLNQQLKKESLTPAQRAQKLKELRPRMVKYLTDNCTCETERKAFPLLNNETLATLVNEKQQGSNADATGDGSFKNAKNAGGWDDVKGKGDAFYDDDDEVSDDEEDETEKEPPNTGGGPDEVRGRKGVSNMRITANQADMFSRAVFGKPLAQVREEQRLAGNVLRHEKTKVIKKLVAHLPRERAEQTVLNMRLYDKSLEELHDLVALQPPPAVNSGFDDADELRSPIYAAGGMPPLMNEEFVDNSGAASDIECLVPPTINYKQWQEEDRGTRNGRAIRQHANDGIESFNTTGDMM